MAFLSRKSSASPVVYLLDDNSDADMEEIGSVEEQLFHQALEESEAAYLQQQQEHLDACHRRRAMEIDRKRKADVLVIHDDSDGDDEDDPDDSPAADPKHCSTETIVQQADRNLGANKKPRAEEYTTNSALFLPVENSLDRRTRNVAHGQGSVQQIGDELRDLAMTGADGKQTLQQESNEGFDAAAEAVKEYNKQSLEGFETEEPRAQGTYAEACVVTREKRTDHDLEAPTKPCAEMPPGTEWNYEEREMEQYQTKKSLFDEENEEPAASVLKAMAPVELMADQSLDPKLHGESPAGLARYEAEKIGYKESIDHEEGAEPAIITQEMAPTEEFVEDHEAQSEYDIALSNSSETNEEETEDLKEDIALYEEYIDQEEVTDSCIEEDALPELDLSQPMLETDLDGVVSHLKDEREGDMRDTKMQWPCRWVWKFIIASIIFYGVLYALDLYLPQEVELTVEFPWL